MIALAVTAGVVVYVYSSGLIGSLQGSKVQQPYLEKISLDYYQWTMGSSANGTLTLDLRNTGSTQVTLADFFIASNPLHQASDPDAPQHQHLKVNAPAIDCYVDLFWAKLHPGSIVQC